MKPHSSSAGSIAIKAEKTPVLLIPEPRRSQIVVAAPTNVLAQVKVWLQTLDQPKPPSTKWEIVEVEFREEGGRFVVESEQVVLETPPFSVHDDVAPDGRFVVVTRSEEVSPEIKVITNWFDELERIAPTKP